jgi:hypothetical protein
MLTRSKSLLTIVVLIAGVSTSCGSGSKEKEAEASHSAPAPAPPPLPAGVSQSLTRNSAPPAYNFDNLGPINYPAVQKSNEISGDADNAVSGWALDLSQKGTAGGVDVVIDQVPYAAHYGAARTDVADHFKRPDCTNSGFHLNLARGQLPKGQHTVSIRVISADKKSYNEGPVVQFTVK